MTLLDRRSLLRNLLGGVVASAVVSGTFAPGLIIASPMPVSRLPTAPAENLVEEARVVVHHHHHHHRHSRHWHHHRRHVCWWHQGRHVCGWR
ncbi:hypothetical protein [Methylocapsa palsarum]|uniref:Uncharacterized protein n=1 Tax=Methylocapsa palsarum TaxID=1612308 RepID=A0A1I3XFM6_9HYPH|nr:hypothetical protein [Methylocapsa palsarum]SFK18290.1 hypothetical protein SAMN05444581_10392 [Methylocapsa palsarum]